MPFTVPEPLPQACVRVDDFRFSDVVLERKDVVWHMHWGGKSTPPVMDMCGIFLGVSLEAKGSRDNQPITWLMIDKDTGFAPLTPWQRMPGPATVVRMDYGPLTAHDFEYIHDYMSQLLDVFGSGRKPKPTVASFQEFCRAREDDRQPPHNLLMPRVRVHGLTSPAGLALNGTEGYRSLLPLDTGRYAFFVDGTTAFEAKNVKPEHLTVLA